MAKAKITETRIAALKPGEQVFDTEVSGFGARRQKDQVSFFVKYTIHGKQRLLTIGTTGRGWKAASARREALRLRGSVASGKDPAARRMSGNVAEVVERYIAERASKIKTGDTTARILRRYVLPEWKHRDIERIERSHITALLDKIAEGQIKYGDRKIGTPGMAKATFAQISAVFTWYAAKYASDNFRSPVVRGMVEADWRFKPRDRVLSDDELRAMWTACGEQGVYGAAVLSALLTAQRFHRVTSMRRSDIRDAVWDSRSEGDADNKQASEVPLSSLAHEIIDAVPVIDGGDFVFSVNGKKPMNSWSDAKERLDARMGELLSSVRAPGGQRPCGQRPWQHRDLRRTARSLMSRAGVSREISERCLGHVMAGVEGVYDRHSYLDEKREAFAKLAELVRGIVMRQNVAS